MPPLDVAEDLRAADVASVAMREAHDCFLTCCRERRFKDAETARLVASANLEAHCDALVRAYRRLADGGGS